MRISNMNILKIKDDISIPCEALIRDTDLVRVIKALVEGRFLAPEIVARPSGVFTVE